MSRTALPPRVITATIVATAIMVLIGAHADHTITALEDRARPTAIDLQAT
jgi:hypothetical protein